jgi:hypothetical protein
LVSRVWDISSGIGPCFPLAGGLCKFYANAGGKLQIQRHTLLSMQENKKVLNSKQQKILAWNRQ